MLWIYIISDVGFLSLYNLMYNIYIYRYVSLYIIIYRYVSLYIIRYPYIIISLYIITYHYISLNIIIYHIYISYIIIYQSICLICIYIYRCVCVRVFQYGHEDCPGPAASLVSHDHWFLFSHEVHPFYHHNFHEISPWYPAREEINKSLYEKSLQSGAAVSDS